MSDTEIKDRRQTVWARLSAIDVSKHVEKKGQFSYLSWAWAWATLKENYPEAYFHKHQNTETGLPFFKDPDTKHAYVCVTLHVRKEDHPITEVYPVLNNNNRPIENPSAFDVNNALQRCMVKAIAYAGLGHYIYAGEDLPMLPRVADITDPKGEVKQVKGTDMIREVFLTFIPEFDKNTTLSEFWKKNKTAIAILQEHDSAAYGEVVGAFKKKRDELT